MSSGEKNEMGSLMEIEKAVTRLPREEYLAFREWFEEFDAKEWDDAFEKDAISGKFDRLAEQAMNDFKAGKCKAL